MSTKLNTAQDLAEKMLLMAEQGGHDCSKKKDNLCKDCCCQLGIGFLLREGPFFVVATVAIVMDIWTIFPYAIAASTALSLYLWLEILFFISLCIIAQVPAA